MAMGRFLFGGAIFAVFMVALMTQFDLVFVAMDDFTSFKAVRWLTYMLIVGVIFVPLVVAGVREL